MTAFCAVECDRLIKMRQSAVETIEPRCPVRGRGWEVRSFEAIVQLGILKEVAKIIPNAHKNKHTVCESQSTTVADIRLCSKFNQLANQT